MGGYSPVKIAGMTTGLVQSREEFILPNDAYPVLENAFVWRERIKRKQGWEFLGRFRRILTTVAAGNISALGAGIFTFPLFTGMGINVSEPNAELQPGSAGTTLVVTIAAPISQTLTDTGGVGTMVIGGAGPITSATINYATGVLTLTFSGAAGVSAATITGAYFPGLPAMGLRSRELSNINNEQTVGFDTKYAYRFTTAWQEFIPGTTWTGDDSDFFWSTNYWVNGSNQKLFWVTNFSGPAGDPIRYTDGTTWTNFAPTINAAGDVLAQCLCILPFRGRLVTFNTYEGANLGASVNFPQRIRWAAIGSPFPATAWRDDIRGQGGFLDIPTSQNIVSVGFVRDNLVIYCESSTWQLRYTGRSISPFQIEKVNSELGAESTFSAVQFDTSLVGIGDKGVVECDSFKSQRIDIKIPDLVFQFNNQNDGPKRIHGIRDFVQRLAFWTYPYVSNDAPSVTYPNRRLVYNYENDSWAIFTDSLTVLGTFQPPQSRTWANSPIPWNTANFPWVNRPALIPQIVGGNQQGFVMYLDQQTTNDVSLSITGITGNTTTPTTIEVVNHNLANPVGGTQLFPVIQISGIPTGTPFATSLNGQIFGVSVVDADNLALYVYNPITEDFSTPQLDAPGAYIGGGKVAIRDGFRIRSKQFNFMDEGENIQMGYVDVLMDTSDDGAITLNVYADYNENSPVNRLPQNQVPATQMPDTFFNSVVPTTTTGGLVGTKSWQKVYCPTRAAFLSLEWTLSNAQLVGVEQENDVQIDASILWVRKAGRIQTGGA